MLTYQGCPQTPGGRIRALGFARMGTRGDAVAARGPAVCHCYSSPVLPESLNLISGNDQHSHPISAIGKGQNQTLPGFQPL